MINEKMAKSYCNEDISKIENYEIAIADKTHRWDCHHRDEIKVLPSGIKVIRSMDELKENNRYYNCPANELIFLTSSEHSSLHFRGVSKTCEHKKKIGRKGIKHKMSEEGRAKIAAANRLKNKQIEFIEKVKESKRKIYEH